ncbi:hypothetical protein JW948_08960 [bacterium]|nr:hypothetical protein [bacterium]
MIYRVHNPLIPFSVAVLGTSVLISRKEGEPQEWMASAEAVLKTARRGFEIAEVTAYNGLATQLQLKDAGVGYDQAMLNHYAAIYDYLDACIDWELATGISN